MNPLADLIIIELACAVPLAFLVGVCVGFYELRGLIPEKDRPWWM